MAVYWDKTISQVWALTLVGVITPGEHLTGNSLSPLHPSIIDYNDIGWYSQSVLPPQKRLNRYTTLLTYEKKILTKHGICLVRQYTADKLCH